MNHDLQRTLSARWGEERTPTPLFFLAVILFIVVADSTSLVAVNHPRLDRPVDARIRPIRRKGHMAVFHRITMDVFHRSREISFVSGEVFPIPTLPDAAFSYARPAGAPVFPLGVCREHPVLMSIHRPE